ncbi:MAG: hypothetical protein IPM14_05425 [bacterium]|nr:hypothetical protein [bacterium]
MNTIKALLVILVFSLTVFLNCAEDNSSKNISKENPAGSLTEKSICDLLSKEEVGQIMGAKFEEATQTLHTVDKNAGSYVSQCAYYTNKGLQHVAILVRYFKGTTFPQTAEGFLSASKVGDAELDEQVDDALKNYIPVEGLGDVAFCYSMWDSNSLVVHWDKHYEMIISMDDFSLDPPTIEKLKQLAKEVMKKIG